MPDLYVRELPYQEDIIDYFQQLIGISSPILLDSGSYNSNEARYDILTGNPKLEFEANTALDAKTALSNASKEYEALRVKSASSNNIPFCGGLIGYLSYDYNQCVEDIPQPLNQDFDFPLIHFALVGWAIVTDHQLKKTQLVAQPWQNQTELDSILQKLNIEHTLDSEHNNFKLTSPFTSNLAKHSYLEKIDQIKNYILQGDCYQVNFAQRFAAKCEGASWDAYKKLRKTTRAPFSAYIETSTGAILSASPEKFYSINNSGKVETTPIKGTRPRGSNPSQDKSLAEELSNSAKDRAENLMIVDLLRNDISKVCDPNSVKTPELFKLHSFSNVHHLISRINGDLSEDKTALDLLKATFPGGSITGAPKVRAMEIINELEPNQRSIYCGSIGYISFDGQSQFNICIRTMLRSKDNIYCWGGGGIVADSDPEEEYQESINKIDALMKSVE